MPIYDDVNQQLKEAMKAQDKVRMAGLRGIRAGLIEEMKKDAANKTVSDEAAIAVLRRLQKQRNDSIEAYEKGGRSDLVAEERGELAVIESFLPKLADDATTTQWVREAIAAIGATSTGQVGQVVGQVMKAHKGMVDGKRVKEIAEHVLGGV
jgi:uncharacterized protein YqeY